MTMVTNLHTDPHAYAKGSAASGTVSANGSHWSYPSGAQCFPARVSTLPVGRVICLAHSGGKINGIQNATNLWITTGYYAGVVVNDQWEVGFWPQTVDDVPVTITGIAVYESESVWDQAKALYDAKSIPTPIISGDMMPLN